MRECQFHYCLHPYTDNQSKIENQDELFLKKMKYLLLCLISLYLEIKKKIFCDD